MLRRLRVENSSDDGRLRVGGEGLLQQVSQLGIEVGHVLLLCIRSLREREEHVSEGAQRPADALVHNGRSSGQGVWALGAGHVDEGELAHAQLAVASPTPIEGAVLNVQDEDSMTPVEKDTYRDDDDDDEGSETIEHLTAGGR